MDGLGQDQLPYGMICIQMSIHEYIRILATFEINIDKKLLKLEFFIDFLKIMPNNCNYLANFEVILGIGRMSGSQFEDTSIWVRYRPQATLSHQ